MRRYAVVIERADDGSFSAYVPDLPGCVAVGQDTPAAARQLIHDAIEAHIAGLIEDGLPVPDPTTLTEYVAVDAA
jgi:predicted RNase H-like HicB family nuclease